METVFNLTATEAADALTSWDGDLDALVPLADRYVEVARRAKLTSDVAIDADTWCKLTAAAARTMAALVLESIGAEERGDEGTCERANLIGRQLQAAAIDLCDAYPLANVRGEP